MSTTIDRPEPNNNKKKTPSDTYVKPYYKYSVDELLDERNYYKSKGMNTEEIDTALSNKYGYLK